MLQLNFVDCFWNTIKHWKWKHGLAVLKERAYLVAAIVTFALAFKNTIQWQLESFWSASGDVMTDLWISLYKMNNNDDYQMAVWGTITGLLAIYWAISLFLLLVDVTGMPNLIYKYKIQDEKNEKPPTKKIVKAIALTVFNQTVVTFPLMVLWYHLAQWRGISYSAERLPTFQVFMRDIVVCVIMEEIAFYYGHRFLHHPRIYKYIHKIHHEWTTPIGIMTAYCHPVEHVIANILPIFSGPLIMGSHGITSTLWGLYVMVYSIGHHSGYHVPIISSPQAHDYHHLKFTVNYGVIGILDWYHGTNDSFIGSKQEERHQFLLSLTPIHELYPDDPGTKKKKKR